MIMAKGVRVELGRNVPLLKYITDVDMAKEYPGNVAGDQPDLKVSDTNPVKLGEELPPHGSTGTDANPVGTSSHGPTDVSIADGVRGPGAATTSRDHGVTGVPEQGQAQRRRSVGGGGDSGGGDDGDSSDDDDFGPGRDTNPRFPARCAERASNRHNDYPHITDYPSYNYASVDDAAVCFFGKTSSHKGLKIDGSFCANLTGTLEFIEVAT